MRVGQLFNTLLFTQQEEEEVRVSQLFNTLLFTQQQKQEEQEVRVSQLFNTLLFTQQQKQEEQEVRVSQLLNNNESKKSCPGSGLFDGAGFMGKRHICLLSRRHAQPYAQPR